MNGWETQYAIRMPNGELFSMQRMQTERDYSVDAATNDMMGVAALFGFGGGATVSKPVGSPLPVIYTNLADAEQQLKHMREQAAQFGVSHWGGEIVHRICTPFTAGQLAGRQFEEALQRGMANNILLPRTEIEGDEQ